MRIEFYPRVFLKRELFSEFSNFFSDYDLPVFLKVTVPNQRSRLIFVRCSLRISIMDQGKIVFLSDFLKFRFSELNVA